MEQFDCRREKWKGYCYILGLIVLVGLFIALNEVIPFVKNDIVYRFSAGVGTKYDFDRPMHTMSDVWTAEVDHYLHANGRFSVQFLAQAFCVVWGKQAYNILAAVLFAILIPISGRFAFPKVSEGLRCISYGMFMMLLLWIIADEPSAFYAGVVFGMNYLYALVICIGYALLLGYASSHAKTWLNVLLCLTGFLAGESHELFVAGFGPYLLCWSVVRLKALSKSQIASLILYVLGALILVLAPSNFCRSDYEMEVCPWGLLYVWLQNYSLVITAIVIGLLYAFDRRNLISFLKKEYALVVAFLTTYVFLALTVGSIYASGRILMGTEFWGVVIVCRYIANRNSGPIVEKMFPLTAGAFILLLACILPYQRMAGRYYSQLYSECEKNTEACYYMFPTLHIPSALDKFVYYRHEIGHNEKWDKTYCLIYHKPVYISDECATSVFDKGKKIPGDNPFYTAEGYIYSRTPMPEKACLSIDKGEYCKWDGITLMKRILCLVRPSGYKHEEMEVPFEKVYLSPEEYVYRAVDVLAGEVRRVVDVKVNTDLTDDADVFEHQ